MMRNYRLRASVALVAAGLVAGCNSLDVTNPNAPDRERALATGADLVSLLQGGYQSWYFSMQNAEPSIASSTMALSLAMSWGNFGSRVYSSVPRVGLINSATNQDIGLINAAWYNNYSAIVSANLVIGQINAGVNVSRTDPTANVTALAPARFLQGAALANIALVYNQGFIVDETINPDTVSFQSRSRVRDAALAKLDAVITQIGPSPTFTPVSLLNNAGWSSTFLRRMANTEAARLLTYFPRSRAEVDSVPWARVITYARAGITTDALVEGDNVNWFDDLKGFGASWDGWTRVNQRVVDILDPAQPTPYPLTGRPAAPTSNDQRFDVTPRDETEIGEQADDFIYVPFDIFNRGRGAYHFSDVGHARYDCHSYDAPDGGGLCPVPMRLAAEVDLILAEALVRSGGSRAEAAALVNRTRVARGGHAALTGSETSATGLTGLVPATYFSRPAENADILLRAIFFEREIELFNTAGMLPYFDARRLDRYTTFSVLAPNDLANTARQMPVPARELETLRRQLYSFTGADSVSARVGRSADAAGVSLSVASAPVVRIGGRAVSGPGEVADIARSLQAASRRARWLPRN